MPVGLKARTSAGDAQTPRSGKLIASCWFQSIFEGYQTSPLAIKSNKSMIGKQN